MSLPDSTQANVADNELEDEPKTLVNTPPENEVPAITTQFIASMFVVIFDNILKMASADDGFWVRVSKKAAEVTMPTDPSKLSEYIVNIRAKILELFNGLFPGFSLRIQQLCGADSPEKAYHSLITNKAMGVDMTNYLNCCAKSEFNQRAIEFENKEGQNSQGAEVYRGLAEGVDKIDINIEYTVAYFAPIIYTVIRDIVDRCDKVLFDAFKVFKGEEVAETDFERMWREACKSKCTSILSENRGDLQNVVTFDEPFTKCFEFACAIYRANNKFVVKVGDEYIHVIQYVDPSYFHTSLESIEYKDGKFIENPTKYANDILEVKKKHAASLGLQNRLSINDKAFWNKFKDNLQFKYLCENGKNPTDLFGKNLPQIMSNLVTDISDTLCNLIRSALKTEESINPFVADMFKNIIERGLLEYYAWMNVKKYEFVNIRTNCLSKIPKEFESLQNTVYSVNIPQVRNAIAKCGMFFPKVIKPEEYETFRKLLLLPISENLGRSKDGKTHYWRLAKQRALVTELWRNGSLVPCNATPKGIIAWIYAATEEARQEIMEKNGNVEIDGKKFMLLIYNPNADFEKTGFGFVRGCWFILFCDEHGVWQFRVLTRNEFVDRFGQTRVNVMTAFTYTDAYQVDKIVTVTHNVIPLPPTQIFGAGEDKLQNEFQLLFDYLYDPTNGILTNMKWIAKLRGEFADKIKNRVSFNTNLDRAFGKLYVRVVSSLNGDEVIRVNTGAFEAIPLEIPKDDQSADDGTESCIPDDDDPEDA
jgi:hypothetical protein